MQAVIFCALSNYLKYAYKSTGEVRQKKQQNTGPLYKPSEEAQILSGSIHNLTLENAHFPATACCFLQQHG